MFPLEKIKFEKKLQEIQKLCELNSFTVATAESCTGGLIGALLSHHSGSSSYYLGSIVSYSNRIKTDLLNIPSTLIANQGAVSQEVAELMATHVRDILQSDFALAVTGIAGPAGGSVEKPVGTVWCAWSGPGQVRSQKSFFSGDRETIRALTSWYALDGLFAMISDHTSQL